MHPSSRLGEAVVLSDVYKELDAIQYHGEVFTDYAKKCLFIIYIASFTPVDKHAELQRTAELSCSARPKRGIPVAQTYQGKCRCYLESLLRLEDEGYFGHSVKLCSCFTRCDERLTAGPVSNSRKMKFVTRLSLICRGPSDCVSF